MDFIYHHTFEIQASSPLKIIRLAPLTKTIVLLPRWALYLAIEINYSLQNLATFLLHLDSKKVTKLLLVVAYAYQVFWSLQLGLHFCSRSISHRCNDGYAFQLHISHYECRSKSQTQILLAFTFICLSRSRNLRGCQTGKSIRGINFAPSCVEGLQQIFFGTEDLTNRS